jgi:hypothetical protein
MKKLGLNIISVIILLSTFSTSVFSQEKLGIANSNYSSTNSIFLNPSSSVDSRTFIQMNLIGANAYLMTNSAYLPAFSLWRAVGGGYKEKPVILTNNQKNFFYGNFALDAPAVVVSHRRIGIGIFARGRAEIDIRRIPYQLTSILVPLITNSITATVADFDLKNVKISNMSWAEYGLNFGTMIKKRNGLLITAGGNIKYLTGINLFYANMGRFNAYMKDTLIDIKNLKGKVRVSQPKWSSGKGVGIDFGITYRRALKSETEYEGYYVNSKRSNCQHIDYLYKLGFSLLDLGYINFASKTYKANVDGSLRIPNYNNAGPVDLLIQNGFRTTVKRNVPIKATLPTALSAQLDLNMSHHFYLNGTIIKSIIPASVIGVQRANLISVTPRYERRQVEVAIPITFHRFLYPQLGLAFRFRSFVLGFDNVFPLFYAKNTYGLNAYFNLGISLFRNPACRTKQYRKKKEKTQKRATTDCPKFGKRNF